jgi:hypothetical protein
MVEGKLQIEGEVIHVIVKRCFNLPIIKRPVASGKRGFAGTAPGARGRNDGADP